MIPLCNIFEITYLLFVEIEKNKWLPGVKDGENECSYCGGAQGSLVETIQLTILIKVLVT